MKEEEKALAEKVSSFFKGFAPTKVRDIRYSEADIVLSDNDIDNFIRVVMCYKTNEAPLFPVFINEGLSIDTRVEVWFLPSVGPKVRIRIDGKYLKEVFKNG